MRRIELLNLSNNSKIILQVALIEAFTKLPPKDGSNMFSGGTKIVMTSGLVVHVRDFYSVVDFLISLASKTDASQEIAFSYFAGEDAERDEAYALFKTLSNRDVASTEETKAQAAAPEAPAVF